MHGGMSLAGRGPASDDAPERGAEVEPTPTAGESIEPVRSVPSQPRRERPLRRDAERNRERVLVAARQLFVEQGLDVGVEEIARRAGVGIGTLYRRFPNKDALIEAILESVVDQLRAIAEDVLATEPAATAVRVFVIRSVTTEVCQGAFLSSRLWSGRTKELLFAEVVPLIGQMFVRAQETGVLRKDIVLSDLIVLVRSMRVVVELTEEISPGAWLRHLDIILDGLRPGADNTRLAHPPIPFDVMAGSVAEPAV